MKFLLVETHRAHASADGRFEVWRVGEIWIARDRGKHRRRDYREHCASEQDALLICQRRAERMKLRPIVWH